MAKFTISANFVTELESRGHTFRTRSDTETIVHAYEEWGEQCAARLHGMFAFAIVEMPQGAAGRATRVFIARDPLGIKPLYYAIVDGAFLFASEVRALLASGKIAALPLHGGCFRISAFWVSLRTDDTCQRNCLSSARPFSKHFRERANSIRGTKVLLAAQERCRENGSKEWESQSQLFARAERSIAA